MSDKFLTWEEAVAWLIAQPDKQDLVRDCYFDGTPLDAARRYLDGDEWRAIAPFLPAQPGSALDLGAGRGIASYALARGGWSVTAIEPDPSPLVGGNAIRQLAEAENLPIHVVQEFGESLPAASASMDLIFARQVLHHARDLPALCMEMFRVLKPGGRMIAVRDHVISKQEDLPRFFQVHPLHQFYGGENAYLAHQYEHALRNAGFRIDRILRPFDSVINYAPYSRTTLRQELKNRLARLPLGSVAGRLLDVDALMSLALKLLSRLDNRPGRLYSFICTKPLN